jgi:hypothetical protein
VSAWQKNDLRFVKKTQRLLSNVKNIRWFEKVEAKNGVTANVF